jgi:hypothetical protein
MSIAKPVVPLSETHQELIRASGISPEVAIARGDASTVSRRATGCVRTPLGSIGMLSASSTRHPGARR